MKRGHQAPEPNKMHRITKHLVWFWKWAEGRPAPESLEMYGTPCFFIILEIGEGVASLRIIRNTLNLIHFHSFGRGGDGGGRLQNQQKYMA